MSPAAIVNGDNSPTYEPSSAFLSHLISYPLIHDSLQTIQSNPYASKPISLTQSLTHHVLEHLQPIQPYLNTPYQYISPYLSKADSLGDSTLSTIDSKFPIVKKPTGELYNDGKGLVFFPVRKGLEGKDYVFKTYDGEVKKGEGVVGVGKAVLVTGLVVTGDLLKWVSAALREKKAEVKEVVSEKS